MDKWPEDKMTILGELTLQASIVTLQNQIDSLAAVFLQIHRGFDDCWQGDVSMVLIKEYHFYADQSEIIGENAKKF